MTTKKIIVLPGDGIGIEITNVAIEVLTLIKKKLNLKIEIESLAIGGASYDLHGTPLTDEVLNQCIHSDAVLLGAVGGYKWDNLPFEVRPERALLKIRKSMQLYANVRPIKIYEQLLFTSPLKKEIASNVDFVIIRELTGDLYFGEPRGINFINGQRVGTNTMVYSEEEIVRIADFAFKLALTRTKKLCSIDKANVLETSVLWREIVCAMGQNKYPEVQLSHQYVDNAAMQLIKNPKQFDVILTSNLFGDILSDLAAVIPGSIGLLASVSLGSSVALYEPIHGSAPDIAGRDLANPLATIKCLSMMFEYSFNDKKTAFLIDKAIEKSISIGRTADIAVSDIPPVGCIKMGQIVLTELNKII